MRRDILIFGGVALAVSWLVGVLAALKLTRRIQRLDVAAERIAAGDFDVKIEDASQDELGQLGRTFDQMRVRLASLDRARREFIANASHELRTPLFALGGFLELLTDEDLDEGTRRDFLETAQRPGRAADKARNGPSRSLPARRGTARAWQPSPSISVLPRRSSWRDSASWRRRRDTCCDWCRKPERPPPSATSSACSQIGRSFIENAIRHTPAGTAVDVAVVEDAGTASLSVHDNGPGIRPEDQQHLFERFYRGEGSAAFGSGIGLAIARELAIRMGGTIELESQAGRNDVPVGAAGRTAGRPVST